MGIPKWGQYLFGVVSALGSVYLAVCALVFVHVVVSSIHNPGTAIFLGITLGWFLLTISFYPVALPFLGYGEGFNRAEQSPTKAKSWGWFLLFTLGSIVAGYIVYQVLYLIFALIILI